MHVTFPLQDIFSYNVEQARGDTHNMIVILMKYHGHSLQSAMDYAGSLCAQTIDTFTENKKRVPSWGPQVDDMVARYVHGLQDWIVGCVIEAQRYSGRHSRPFCFPPDHFIGAFKPTVISATKE